MPRQERVDTSEELSAEEDDMAVAEPGETMADSPSVRDPEGANAGPAVAKPPAFSDPALPSEQPQEDEAPVTDREEDADEWVEVPNEAAEGPAPPQFSFKNWIARFGRTEWISLGGFLLIAVVAAILFFNFIGGGVTGPGRDRASRSLSLPLKGKIVKLTGVDHHWRDRQPGDHGRSDYLVLPEARLTLDPGSSNNGYVRVEFADPTGRIRGDVVTVKVEGGKFKGSGRGGQVSADGAQVAMVCTEGFESSTIFRAYLGNEEPRWTIRLEEGPDYSKGPWSTLGFVQIRNEKK
jgi:hypothetical protein